MGSWHVLNKLFHVGCLTAVESELQLQSAGKCVRLSPTGLGFSSRCLKNWRRFFKIVTGYGLEKEWFSNECGKTQTKEIALANYNRHKQHSHSLASPTPSVYVCYGVYKEHSEPIKTRSKSGKTRATKIIGFTSDCLRDWREFFKPITERSKAKPKSKCELLLSTLIWKPLYRHSIRNRSSKAKTKTKKSRMKFTVESNVALLRSLIGKKSSRRSLSQRQNKTNSSAS